MREDIRARVKGIRRHVLIIFHKVAPQPLAQVFSQVPLIKRCVFKRYGFELLLPFQIGYLALALLCVVII